jgi:hypothetical protein
VRVVTAARDGQPHDERIRQVCHLGFGRIVVSDIEIPILSVHLV